MHIPHFQSFLHYSEYVVKYKSWVNSCSMLVRENDRGKPVPPQYRYSIPSLYVYVCSYTCVVKGMSMYGHTCICKWVRVCINIHEEVRRQPQVSFLTLTVPRSLDQDLSLMQSSPGRLGWQPVSCRGCLVTFLLGLDYTGCHHTHIFLTWVLGIEFRPPCFQGKQWTDWAISSTPKSLNIFWSIDSWFCGYRIYRYRGPPITGVWGMSLGYALCIQ